MLCPICKKSDTKVLDSRDEKQFVRRRRECLDCSYRFTTFEKIVSPKIKVRKRNGLLQEYSREKLSDGISTALEKRPYDSHKLEEVITDIEQEIIRKPNSEVKSVEIGEMAIKRLKEIDEVAYLRFMSVFKKFGSAKKFQKEAEKLSEI